MNKKVTIQDVATAAGVCKATVSYVLNNNQNQTISEATQKKVWQVVNLLGYRPNAFAQNMRVSQEKRMIALYFPAALSALETLSLFGFIQALNRSFRDKNYSAVLLENIPERIYVADAIVACGVTKEDFFALGECNFIPLISVDCRINDPLFFEISWDYPRLKQIADRYFQSAYTYVCPPPRDPSQREAILAVFADAVFADKVADLVAIRAENVFVTDDAYREILTERGELNVFCSDALLYEKTNKIAECVKLALSHEPYPQHIFRV